MNPLRRTIFRWHFYAGLFVVPFVLVLSLSGAAYLFKPEIDRWEESRLAAPSPGESVSPQLQVAAAVAAFRGSRFEQYRLPQAVGEPAMVHLGLPDGRMRDVFVTPGGKVVGSFDPDKRITALIARFHGSLFAGQIGDWLVELAASWALLLILSGLYLWWPRGQGLAGVVWPRRRAGLRDLHAVTGFWVSGLAIVMLVSGLPWAGAWGGAFKAARTELGLIAQPGEWKIGAAAASQHVAHDHEAMMAGMHGNEPRSLQLLPEMVRRARVESLAFPALVLPPGAPQRFGAPTEGWTIKSEAQDRTLGRSVTYDAAGREIERTGFADKHPIDKLVGLGISWHEGQLFGWVNQLVGLLTAIALIAMTITSFLMWRRRKPEGALGAPQRSPLPAGQRGMIVAIVALGLLLPLLGLSMIALWFFDRAVLPRMPATARWLGAA